MTSSKIKIYVERNLGFEAEHHHRALHDIPGVEFYMVNDLWKNNITTKTQFVTTDRPVTTVIFLNFISIDLICLTQVFISSDSSHDLQSIKIY